MKRNWDTIRGILLELDSKIGNDEWVISSDGGNDLAYHHMRLLIESGLAEGDDNLDERTAHVSRLTWEGHELLDQIRSDVAWDKIKETARIKGVDLGMDTVKAIAAIVAGKLIS